ncbi:MAG: T9SS type A sorting domain-containing protein [Sphingobacteriales bacterium]|nr:MAG: T9SS type A sorting domain-containing protein [Sphingobacteriales bacterium]
MRNEKNPFPVSGFRSGSLTAALPDTEEESHRFKQLVQLETALAQSNLTYLDITSEEEALVREIAATNTLAAMDARIILYSAYGEEIVFALPVLPPIIADSLGNWNIHFKNQGSSNAPSVTVYPNPANEYVNFQLNLKGTDPFSLKIYNGIGIQVQEVIIKDNLAKLSVNTAHWKTGLYYYHLTDNQNTSYTGKFVISGK